MQRPPVKTLSLVVLIGAIIAIQVPIAGAASVTESAPPAAPAPPAPPPVSTSADYGSGSNAARALALVDAAINMTDSQRAVKLLWQAIDIDPALPQPYMYLALYYNSRSNFAQVVDVYKKLLKYQPNEVSAYLNIGEAYMSLTPARMDEALPYYQKALSLDPASSFAALRLGQIYAQQGNRSEAVKFLKLASSDRAKNPDVAAQADKFLREMGS